MKNINRLLYSLVIVFFLGFTSKINAQVYINEILSANNTVNYDPHFINFSDWIELYNPGPDTLNLRNYSITDDIDVPDKYRLNFDLVINPQSFYLVWADKENWYPHTNFSLDLDGEYIGLYDPHGILVDSFSYRIQLPDISYGRFPDGSSHFQYMPNPSPYEKNRAGASTLNHISDTVRFSQKGGLFATSLSVTLSSADSGAVIRYTLDGTTPSAGSELYTSPILVNDNKVIRARYYKEGFLPGPVNTQSFITNQDHSLPVVSLVSNPDYFFHYHYGIYEIGNNGIIANCTDYEANFNQPWERTINFELYSPESECWANQTLGTKIAGRCSRTKPLKSLGLYSRSKYGQGGIGKHQIFSDKDLNTPKTLLLRNSGTEMHSTFLRDGFMQTLIKDRMDMDYQAYQPVVVYLNGEYWGIHNLREKMNEHYVQSNYGIDPDDIDLLEINTLYNDVVVIKGDRSAFDSLYAFISDGDMSLPANYRYVQSQMDVDQFMNIYIANIFFENEDWPNNNNKFWREKTPTGKWRWYMYDLDFGFGFWPKSGNTVKWLFSDRWYSRIAYKLKDSERFRSEFVQRMACHLNTTFKPERVLHILDSLKGNIDEEMYRHIEKWGAPYSHNAWVRNLDSMVRFTETRAEIVMEQIIEEFELSDTFHLDITNAHPHGGKIKIAGVDIPDTYTGFYFSDVPLRIQAIPEPGYQFAGWSGDISGSHPEEFILANTHQSVVASFESASPIQNLYINEFMASNTNGFTDENNELEDWIELYNGNDFPIDLAGLFITDSTGLLTKYQIPGNEPDRTTVGANSYTILWADKDTEEGVLHLPFKLKRGGETIVLSQQVGETIRVIDSISYREQYSNVSSGRDPDNLQVWKFLNPTPGKINQELLFENIFINELMPANLSTIQNEEGDFPDWIEIYNANDYEVNIAGMFVSDDNNDPLKYRIPITGGDSTLIPPYGFLLLWADNSTELGCLHLNFKLSSSGETLLISQPNGVDLLDSVNFPALEEDVAFGRIEDGSEAFSQLLPTPGASNLQPSFTGIYINELMPANESFIEDRPGEFDDWFELYNDNEYPLNIAGLYLSDNDDDLRKFRIASTTADSTTIPANGHLVFWADNSPEQGILHTNFKLSSRGEKIILSSPSGIEIIDSVSYSAMPDDTPLGRISDGHPQFAYMLPSPGDPNISKITDSIFINEILAVNSGSGFDEYGESDDWIEIYNGSSTPVNLAGMFITDSYSEGPGYRIPASDPEQTTIQPKGYLLLWADDSTDQGILHTDFKLNKEGETIILLQADGNTVADSIVFEKQYTDISTGRALDGSIDITFLNPSPLHRNTPFLYEGLIISEIMASDHSLISDDQGEYEDWIELFNESDQAIDISRFMMTDSLQFPSRHRFPGIPSEKTTIQPGEYLLLWADKEPDQGALHLNFGLSARGEQVGLFTPFGLLIDSITFPHQQKGFSYSKVESHTWLSLPPTPGRENSIPEIRDLFINEFVSDNKNRLQDANGEYDDWIELYNNNRYAVDIGGLYITDSIHQKSKYRFPGNNAELTTIPPKGYIIIWADNDPEQGPLHTNFKLSKKGEEIILSGYDHEHIIDSISYHEQYSNFARARLNNLEQWIDMPPTPLAYNGLPDMSMLYINELMPLNDENDLDGSGEKGDWIEFYNAGPEHINLGGLYIADQDNIGQPFRISSDQPDSTRLSPNDHMLLWTDESAEARVLYTDIKLRQQGGEVVLLNYDAKTIIDSIHYYRLPKNHSYGRLPDGNSPWEAMSIPTPLEANTLSEPLYVPTATDNVEFDLYPVPASDYIVFSFNTTGLLPITIKIFDKTGKLVAIPLNTHRFAGEQEIHWDLSGADGKRLSSGIYFCQVELKDSIIRRKLIVVSDY